MFADGQGAVGAVDVRNQFVEQVIFVAPKSAGVDVLCAAEDRPAVRQYRNHGLHFVHANQAVNAFGKRFAPSGGRKHEGAAAAVPRQHIDDRVTSGLVLVVTGWQVNGQHPLDRVSGQVVL
jgi:hypothetical protein